LKIKYRVSHQTNYIQGKARGRTKEKIAYTGADRCGALNYKQGSFCVCLIGYKGYYAGNELTCGSSITIIVSKGSEDEKSSDSDR